MSSNWFYTGAAVIFLIADIMVLRYSFMIKENSLVKTHNATFERRS